MAPSQSLPLDPKYGLTDELRLKILAEAEATSVREAAEKYRVSVRSVQIWRKLINNPKR